MKKIVLLALTVLSAPALGQTFPSPTFSTLTMLGPIVLSGAPTASLNPATKDYADAIAAASIPVITLGQPNGPAKLNANQAVNGLFDAIRTTPTGIQTPSVGSPGDNQALPSLNCTPVAQSGGVAGVCFNMDAPVTLPILPPGNNNRSSSGDSATTVSIGLENYNAATDGTGVGLYVGAEAQPSSGGPTWAINTVTNVLGGAQHGGFGYEVDLNNVSCDPGITGTPTCGPTYGLWVTGLTGFTNTAGLLITRGGGTVSAPLWHFGVDVTSADTAGYTDSSTAVSSYNDGGTHTVGLNMAGAYSANAIQIKATNGHNGIVFWNGIPTTAGPTTDFRINPTFTTDTGALGALISFGGHAGFEIDQNNNVMNTGTGYFNARGNIGALTVGFPTEGATLGWNLTSGSQETDLLLGGGTNGGHLSVYAVDGTGALTTAKGSPIADLSATGVWTAVAFRTNPKTVATLNSTVPCAAGTLGARAAVIDATAPTFLGALTGGGAVITPVFCNGTAWVAG